jgi:hypothetical protein
VARIIRSSLGELKLKVPATVIEYGIAFLFVTIVTMVLWFLFSVIIDCIVVPRRRAEFRKAVISSLKRARLSWEELCEIAFKHQLNQNNACHAIRALYTDILEGVEKDHSNNSMLPFLAGFLADYKHEELYQELPADIRASLGSIKTILGPNASALDPLLLQIKAIVSKKDRINARQRFYTCWGFMFGVIGVVFSVYTYLNSPTVTVSPDTPSATSVPSAQQNNN